ncbi:MAG: NAD-dependent epimerase/dehydratase family protein, partial [Anaerohalosphaeraceae bacterium]
MNHPIHAVTGAFGYSGYYIAKQLLEAGHRVIILTNSLNRPNPFGDKVKAFPFHFYNPDKLCQSLDGVTTLYNTYWVRFNHKTFTFEQAITNTSRLFEAAKKAGVERIVHISITNPS